LSAGIPRERNFGLDLARALAISGVFAAHGFTLQGIPVLDDLRTGVDLFFVLSGFLIGRIYFRSQALGTFALGPFWLSRWWRTLPPYFAALALHASLAHWIPELHVRWYYLFFLQNQAGMHGFPPSWSLCVEEHFYLLLPVLGALTLRFFRRDQMVWLLPVTFFVPLALLYGAQFAPHFVLWRSSPATGIEPGFMTQFRCEGLIGGVWLSYLFVERPQLWLRIKAYARCLWLLLPALLLVNTLHPLGAPAGTLYAVAYMACVRMLYDMQWQPQKTVSRILKRTITGLALAAYSTYLCHYFGFEILRSHVLKTMPRGAEKSLITLGVSFCFCVLFYFAIERPSILTRDRFIASRRNRQLQGEPVTDIAKAIP
jgi:peptidoglycan/LPS O-acetylase OafA/YrhL